MNEPTAGLQRYQATKDVRAGEIFEVVKAGFYVREADGSIGALRLFPARHRPKEGDFWVVYWDGHEAIIPRDTFLGDYIVAHETKEALRHRQHQTAA